MIGSLFVAASLFSAPDFEVTPRPLAGKELDKKTFDVAWCLPETRRASGAGLLEELESLLARRFEIPTGEAGAPPLRNVGDLIAAAWARDANSREKWLEARLASEPSLARRGGEALRQLLLDDLLFGDDWDPEEDEKRDGLLIGEAWDLAAEGAPWKNLDVDADAEQGAVLVRADLAAWKEAESDYRAYPDRVGADYEAIYPIDGTLRTGVDSEGRPFSTLRVYFRCDLPFPFTDYACSLRILNRTDGCGRFVTDIYSTSRDFHWLAGRDVYLPLERSDGTWIGTLVVRAYGFDLDGVPDGGKHRRTALRSSLGSLRQEAETIFQRRGSKRVTPMIFPPDVPVRGRR